MKIGAITAALGLAGSAASTIGSIAGAAKNIGSMFGGWGQTGNSQSQGGSVSQGGGHSESGSEAGTNVEQVQKWLEDAYQYQAGEAARQSQFNNSSMLKQMGYNTLSAIAQGIYNHIENNAAMQYNSAEALANREWQERMSSTAYQRAVEDMKKAGLNPILAYANGGASTPGGSAGTISGASMGLASSSALGVSRSGGFVPNAYSSKSWSKSDWYNAAQSWQQMLSQTDMSPYGMMKTLSEIGKGSDEVVEKAVDTHADKKKIGNNVNQERQGKTEMRQDKTGKYGEQRKPGDYLK